MAIQFFWINMFDNPNPIFKMDCHSYDPIRIQLFLEKDMGQQILNGQAKFYEKNTEFPRSFNSQLN